MRSRYKSAGKVTLIYIIFSVLWIFASDTLIFEHFDHNPQAFLTVALIKGIFFVVLTGSMLFGLMSRELAAREKLSDSFLSEQSNILLKLTTTNRQLEESYDTAINGWAKALELREKETAGHSYRVVALMDVMSKIMGLTEYECVNARRGALLHDIGKMGIPDSILLKEGPLTPAERETIETHTLLAREWLGTLSYLEVARLIPIFHHERMDGSGYPYHLQGESIPFPARIFAVIDVADAMGSDRPYRKALPIRDVYAHLQEESGRLYDPQVVTIFIQHDLMRTVEMVKGYYKEENQ